METVVLETEVQEEVITRKANVTKHFFERYVERILGIKNEHERNAYITNNRERLTEQINRMFNYAQHVWTGQVGDNVTRHYYINQDNILITNSANDALVTTYKCDLGLPENVQKETIKGLVEEIVNLQIMHNELDVERLAALDAVQHKIDSVDLEIANLEDKLALKRQERKNLDAEKQNVATATQFIKKEIEGYALKLVNSIEYRNDIQTLKKAGKE